MTLLLRLSPLLGCRSRSGRCAVDRATVGPSREDRDEASVTAPSALCLGRLMRRSERIRALCLLMRGL